MWKREENVGKMGRSKKDIKNGRLMERGQEGKWNERKGEYNERKREWKDRKKWECM